jgi:cytochrome bd-type quinol oxidase subunit 1
MGYEFMQTARYYLLYSISFVLYCLTAPYRLSLRSTSEKSAKNTKKIFIAVAVVTVATIVAAVIIGQFFVQQQHQQNPEAPNVKFMTFEVDAQEITVGESTNLLINVQSSEEIIIDNAKVVVTIEPSSYEPYLSINNNPIQLPVFLGKDARTGEVKVSITATASPAKEAVYVVKGIVFVNDTQTDIKEFPLTIRQ